MVDPATTTGDLNATYAATLVDELVQRGVTDAVVCPGSRSTPLAVALARHQGVRVHVHHDERSGAFVALGLGMATRRPAIVLTTSGTAAVELHPAVVEAHHASVPLLAITADRPTELQGVHAPQTINQRNLYGDAVRWYCEPGPPAAAGFETWRYIARDAYERAVAPRPGPVHLNVAFREPLLGQTWELPPELDHLGGQLAVFGILDEQLGRLVPAMVGRRGLIAAGVRSVIDDADRVAVLGLAATLGWPVLADHLSGLRVDDPHVVTAFDPLLRHDDTAAALSPEFVLRIGGLLASRVTNERLAASQATHVGLDRYGVCPDPDHLLGIVLHADVAEACADLSAAVARHGGDPPDGWLASWASADSAAAAAISEAITTDVLCEPAVLAVSLAAVPRDGALLVSSSMPVRDLEWYVGSAPEGVTVHANRGANGIDGVISTGVGLALSGMPTVVVLGDVAALHDTNGLLGLADRGLDLLIVVIDNDGGGIFSFLPQADALAAGEFELLFGTPHGVDIAALATAHGIPATRVTDRSQLDEVLADWGGRGTQMVVVDSDRGRNRTLHGEINAAVSRALDAIGPVGVSAGP